jgi:hypothetical protein
MRVFCYRNLHHKGVIWSVRDVRSGLVVDRAKRVVIKDAQLAVSTAGRLKVLKERRKNVHAGVRGERLKRLPKNLTGWVKARYNPYEVNSFVLTDTGESVFAVRYAVLDKNGLRVII